MRLGLLGFPIQHTKSPELYRRFLSERLTSYDLFSCENKALVPDLNYFKSRLDGLNITSPYKSHFFDQVVVKNRTVLDLGSINTIGFSSDGIFGTNTDLVAVKKILIKFQEQYPNLDILLLGDGVMANLTKVVAVELGIPLSQFSRKLVEGFSELNLPEHYQKDTQPIVINACSRGFIFRGELTGEEIFWDYNYAFAPHDSHLSSMVKTYVDGQELLELQAISAIEFWEELTPKLN
jgi:shikimate dehydrogenase